MVSRWFVFVLLSGALALAQEKGAPPPPGLPPAPKPDILRVIDVKEADPAELTSILSRVLNGIASISQDSRRRAVIVRGTPEAVAIVEEAVKRLDQPPAARTQTNIELAVHLLYGSVQDGRGDPVPADLASTIKQLTALFPYKSYRVLESFVLRGRDGEQTEIQGSLPNGASLYTFIFRPSVVAGPPPRMIRLDKLNLMLKLHNDALNSFVDARITTSLDTREGQKVVVGKSNVSGTADAIILVVSPKVVE